MGLARKGSRTLVVDDVRYRWVVSPDSGFMVIVVERDDCDGQRLTGTVPYETEAGELRVTPALARRLVEHGLRSGWQPTGAGLPPLDVHDLAWIAPSD